MGTEAAKHHRAPPERERDPYFVAQLLWTNIDIRLKKSAQVSNAVSGGVRGALYGSVRTAGQ